MTKKQLLSKLNIILKDDQGWMDKYKNLEETPEDGDELITEGRIEILEGIIEDIKKLKEEG